MEKSMPMNDRPKPKSKVEEALEEASVANMVCQQTMVSVHTLGLMFEALLGSIRDNQVISQSDLEAMFHGVAAKIDAKNATDPLTQIAKEAMRRIVEQVAGTTGVQIPPSGEVRMPERH
jgi:hypothetical protein